MKKLNNEPEFIRAKREGVENSFTRATWDMLGPKKQGWEEIVEDPEELKTKKPTAKEIAKIEKDLQDDKDKQEADRLNLIEKEKEEAEKKRIESEPKPKNPEDLLSDITKTGGEA